MLSGKVAAACLTASLALLASRPASAFCRTTTCPSCPFDPVTGCPTGGVPIFWPRSCVSFSLNIAAGYRIDLATATAYAHQAFAAWNSVRCGSGAAPVSIVAHDAFGPVDCEHIEYNSSGPNANVILFREDVWPYEGPGTALALTTVTYDSRTGEIMDADMEINGTVEFIVPGTKGGADQYDLLSIMTHEAGHFLGLAHSKNADAVMQLSIGPRVVRTTPSADDIAGLCAVDPPGASRGTCDFTPKGGFSPQCSLDPSIGGTCTVAKAPGVGAAKRGEGRAALFAIALPLLALVPWARRRRSGGAAPAGLASASPP